MGNDFVLWIVVFGCCWLPFFGRTATVSRLDIALVVVVVLAFWAVVGDTRSCHIFLPMLQMSSQESDPMFKPCVRQSQDTFQARRETPSMKRAYVADSSLTNFGSVLSTDKGRGRCLRVSRGLDRVYGR